MGSVNERDNRASSLKQRVSDVLTFDAFTHLVDAWNNDPDPKKVTWKPLERVSVSVALGYGSVEACQAVSDEMRDQLHYLTVCGEMCLVKNEVIDELRSILGR